MNTTATEFIEQNNVGNMVSNIIFAGNYVNIFIIEFITKAFIYFSIPLSEIQAGYLVLLVYLITLYFVINIIQIAKFPLKIGIILLIIMLVLGFFTPIR